MTVKKQGENQCETPPMEGFSWGVLIGGLYRKFHGSDLGCKEGRDAVHNGFGFQAPGSIALCSGDASFNDQLVQIGMKRLLDF